MATNPDLVFLKLGGSLITDKDSRSTPRRETIERLAAETAAALAAQPGLTILLGHGSGSFGHTAARQHDTARGVSSPQQWLGFAQVWREARILNEIVVDTFARAGLPVIAFPPSAAVTTNGRQVVHWDLTPLHSALSAGLLPIVNGDTVFDEILGGTILSTEDLFSYLARKLQPARILLAGLEPGVWADYPACRRLQKIITPASFSAVSEVVGASASVDVTGGMRQKVQSMLDLVSEIPNLEVIIFSGQEPGLLTSALAGAKPGTTLCFSEGL